MTKLSVNVNKIATLRNSRGGERPDLLQCTRVILGAGADGITVHPRPDERHIKRQDVLDLSALLADTSPKTEFNIEGYPSDDYLDLVYSVAPDQATLVPDPPGVLTSNAGWKLAEQVHFLRTRVDDLRFNEVRSSLFVDVFTLDERELSALEEIKPDRVELFTEAYAKAFGGSAHSEIIHRYREAADTVRKLGIEINAGHDLDLENLGFFLEAVGEIREVSIGHALVSDALWWGLEATVEKYLRLCHRDD